MDRRKFRRLDIIIPLRIRLTDAPTRPEPIDVSTADISPEGVSVEIEIGHKEGMLYIKGLDDPRKVIPYLTLGGQSLEIDIKVLPHGDVIRGKGKVKWSARQFDGAHYRLRAGVRIDEMGGEDRNNWLEFVKTVARLHEIDLVS